MSMRVDREGREEGASARGERASAEIVSRGVSAEGVSERVSALFGRGLSESLGYSGKLGPSEACGLGLFRKLLRRTIGTGGEVGRPGMWGVGEVRFMEAEDPRVGKVGARAEGGVDGEGWAIDDDT